MTKKSMSFRGFTLGELLVVVTIIAILAMIVMMNYQRQIARANDTKRKADLERLKNAFEDYYNDNFCYPDQESMNTQSNCGSAFLSPYIEKMPCDPITKDPYLYMPLNDAAGDMCGGYRLLTTLEDWSDTAITTAGCSNNPDYGCGFSSPRYNYGIAMGGSIALPGFNPNTVPDAEPDVEEESPFITKPIACNENGICNGMDEATYSCGEWFRQGECSEAYCMAHPEIWCRPKR